MSDVAQALDYDVNHGFRIDGSVIRWWSTKTAARDAARSIGWPMNSIERVWTRFQLGYALKQTHGGFLTRDGYARLSGPIRGCATSNEVAQPTESDVPPVGGWGLWPTFRHTESIKERPR